MVRVYSYKVSESPHLLVSGAIHGDEICGPLAIERLRQQIESGSLYLQNGCLTLIPICNPEAHRRNVRYIDKNLNRVFCKHSKPTCYEERLANLLLPYFDQADYLLDIHSFDAVGDPFIFQDHSDPKDKAFAEALGVSPIFTNWVEMYHELKSDASCTTDYVHANGIPGLTLECGQHRDPHAPEVGYQAIQRALVYLKMADLSLQPQASSPRRVRMQSVHFRRHEKDRFAKDWKHLTPVQSGELIATYEDGTQIAAPKDGFVVLPKATARVGDEWVYFGTPEA